MEHRISADVTAWLKHMIKNMLPESKISAPLGCDLLALLKFNKQTKKPAQLGKNSSQKDTQTQQLFVLNQHDPSKLEAQI